MQTTKTKLLAWALTSLIVGIAVGGIGVGVLARHYAQQDRNASHYLAAIGDLRLYLAYLEENPDSLRCLFLLHTRSTKEIIELAETRGEVLSADRSEVSHVLSRFSQTFPAQEYAECVATIQAAPNKQPKPTP